MYSLKKESYRILIPFAPVQNFMNSFCCSSFHSCQIHRSLLFSEISPRISFLVRIMGKYCWSTFAIRISSFVLSDTRNIRCLFFCFLCSIHHRVITLRKAPKMRSLTAVMTRRQERRRYRELRIACAGKNYNDNLWVKIENNFGNMI